MRYAKCFDFWLLMGRKKKGQGKQAGAYGEGKKKFWLHKRAFRKSNLLLRADFVLEIGTCA